MNTINNKRRRTSQSKIEKAFVNMLLDRDINKITVTEICKETGLNRTTFYANYIDIYDLADKIRKKIEDDFHDTFADTDSHNAVTFFNLIYENQIMFKIYFKLGFDKEYSNIAHDIPRAESDFGGKHLQYHMEFFRCGLTAIIKMWLDNGCRETPEEMAEIIKSEYHGRNFT